MLSSNHVVNILEKSNGNSKIKQGDFSFVTNPYIEKMLEFDYNVTEQNKLWDFFKNHDTKKTFMSTLTIVDNYNWYDGHSGSSWALSMRTMEKIAKDGWINFVTNYTNI